MHAGVLAPPPSGRGPCRAPPHGSPGVRTRLAAGAAIVAVVAAATLVTLWSRGAAPAPGREAPFDVETFVAMDPMGRASEVPRPGIVLYVDERCSYCATELQRWAAALRGKATHRPTVLLSPRSDPAAPRVPPILRPGVLHDANGSLARELGVTAVPFLAVLAASGTVTTVRVGLTPGSEIARMLGTKPDEPQEDER